MRALFLLFFCLPSLVFAKSPQEVFEIASKSVVQVELISASEQFEGKASPIGSGVVVAKDMVLTNCHVAKADLDGVLKIRQRGGDYVTAKPYARIKGNDLCLLNTNKPIGEPAKLGKASQLKVGVPVYAIGTPKGLALSFSNGLVSQLRGDAKAPLIQTTAPISPGSSGGGLFDTEGRLVGITTFYLEDGQNLNFALPLEWLDQLYRPESRILNRVGMECQTLIKQKIGLPNSSKQDTAEIFQCIRLINQQIQAAFADDIEPAPTPVTTPTDIPEILQVASSENGSLVVYLKIDTARRMPNGRVQAWFVSDFKSPQFDTSGRYYYRSEMALNEFDCNGRQMGVLSISRYPEPLGQGERKWIGDWAPQEVKYMYIPPESISEEMLKTACSIARRG